MIEVSASAWGTSRLRTERACPELGPKPWEQACTSVASWWHLPKWQGPLLPQPAAVSGLAFAMTSQSGQVCGGQGHREAEAAGWDGTRGLGTFLVLFLSEAVEKWPRVIV